MIARCLAQAALAAAFAGAAAAMPSDQPWDVYGCAARSKPTDAFALRFLSDGLTIELLEPTFQPKTVRAIDEDRQAGFKPGLYLGDGDVRLTMGKDGRISLAGKGLGTGPHKACVKAERAEGLWQAYACKDGKTLGIYFSGLDPFVEVRTGTEATLLNPEKLQPGPDGPKTYRAIGPDLTLTLEGLTASLAGGDVPDGPREQCRSLLKP